MILLNAQGALATLLNVMALPGAIMTAAGSYMWYHGSNEEQENRSRYGRLLVMFGLILLAIVIILTLFIGAFANVNTGT